MGEVIDGPGSGDRLDAVERLLRNARYEAPAGLAARLARAAADPTNAGKVFWLDVERGARRVVKAAVAAAVIAVGAAIGVLAAAPRPQARLAAAPAAVTADASLEDVARFALAPEAFEQGLERELAYGAEARGGK